MSENLRQVERLRRLRVRDASPMEIGGPVQHALDGVADRRRRAAAGIAALTSAPDEVRAAVSDVTWQGKDMVLTIRSAAWRARVANWLRQGGEAMLVRGSLGRATRVRLVLGSRRR